LGYGDLRNVISSLIGEARAEFELVYGPLDQEERLLDEPLDILHELIIASQRENKPTWVASFLKSVSSGELEASIDLALQAN
jgi:hypothetical protein